MSTNLPFLGALAEAVKVEIESAGGAVHLARQVSLAGTEFGANGKFDRRKLSDIANEKNVKVSFIELAVLDAYLSQRGRGLATLMQAPSILQPLASTGKVEFLFGAKPQISQRATMISRWDVLALATLQRSIDRLDAAVHFTLQDVFLSDPPNPAHDGGTPSRQGEAGGQRGADAGEQHIRLAEMFGNDRWFTQLHDLDAPSRVCLGSPRACHATEILICEMLGRDPFKPHKSKKNGLPFHFLLNNPAGLSSAFTMPDPDPDQLARSAARPGQYSGLDFGGKLYRLSKSDNMVTEYGIFLIQRRAAGQVWVVLAGVTGPATYATARSLANIAAELPPWTRGQDSDVLAGLIEAHTTERPGLRGDNREVIDQKLVTQVRWPAPTRRN